MEFNSPLICGYKKLRIKNIFEVFNTMSKFDRKSLIEFIYTPWNDFNQFKPIN